MTSTGFGLVGQYMPIFHGYELLRLVFPASEFGQYWPNSIDRSQLPHHMEDTDKNFLKTMMPWSAEYKEYERINTFGIKPEAPPGIFDSKPQTPSKGGISGSTSEGVA